MTHARRALFAHLRLFVERELGGLFSWDQVEHHPGYPSEDVHRTKTDAHGRVWMIGAPRKNPAGPLKEIVEIKVGAFVVRLHSPHERGPCGLLEVEFPDAGSMIEVGPIDQSSFNRLGKMIRDREAVKV